MIPRSQIESAEDVVQSPLAYNQSPSLPIFGSGKTPFSLAGYSNAPTFISSPRGSGVPSEQANQSTGLSGLRTVTRLTHSEVLALACLGMWKQRSSLAEEQGQPLVGRMVYASARFGFESSFVANATVERMKGRRTGPVQVLSKIAKDWRLSNHELAGLLAYPDSQNAADLLEGSISLRGADREDRVRLLYGIYRVLSSLFSEPSHQQGWLRGATEYLNNTSPLEFMLERRIPGMVSVQSLVERLAGR
jgi:hypothetical protein